MSEKSTPSTLPFAHGKWHLPYPSGQYPVIGYQDIMTGKSRTDGVFLRLLYPREDQSINLEDSHMDWSNWFPHPNYKSGLRNTLPSALRHFLRLIQYFSGEVHVPILPGGKLLKRSKKFPVIIFSHGLSSNRTTYSNICNQFASHGFIVAVVEHRDESAYATVYPAEDQEGFEWLPYRPMSDYGEYESDTHFQGRQEQMQLRLSEIRATVELLQKLNAGTPVQNSFQDEDNNEEFDYGEFKGRIDLENVIGAGHSYGGATIIHSLKHEPVLKMGICLDAWMYSLRDFDADALLSPLLFVNMDFFHTPVALRKIREFLPGDGGSEERRSVKLKNTRHTDVSDFPMLLLSYPRWITSTLNWFVPLISKVNPFAVHQASVSLSLDFINKHGTTAIVNSIGFPPEVELVEGLTLKK